MVRLEILCQDSSKAPESQFQLLGSDCFPQFRVQTSRSSTIDYHNHDFLLALPMQPYIEIIDNLQKDGFGS